MNEQIDRIEKQIHNAKIMLFKKSEELKEIENFIEQSEIELIKLKDSISAEKLETKD